VYFTTKADREVVKCPSCALWWVPDGLVRDQDGTSIYEQETPIFLQDGNEQYYLDDTNLLSFATKLAWVKRLAQPVGDKAGRRAKLLDVGAGFGHFLSLAMRDYDATGLEVSTTAVAWGRERLQVNNHAASIYDLPSELRGPYDVVTSWDVIEHVPDPLAALRAMRAVMRPGGILFLSTPDAGSAVARAMGPRWHYLDPVQHIVLFGRQNLSRLLEQAGFKPFASRSFGHHYRVGYVLDRLSYLYSRGLVGSLVRATRTVGRVGAKRVIYLSLGDVMGLAARAI
jgi:2-polyprenyl-3-methyl-5-hydroxy-6-metoxy-1,4-benzoquinol methylase